MTAGEEEYVPSLWVFVLWPLAALVWVFAMALAIDSLRLSVALGAIGLVPAVCGPILLVKLAKRSLWASLLWSGTGSIVSLLGVVFTTFSLY